jgi:DNA replication ATP-dependent helicase Dna2
LTRIIGRHLQAILRDQTINYLAWLFPAEELLPNPALVTRRSPVTIVQDVVRTLLAAPIPHYYSMLALARLYHDAQLPASVAQFSIHPLFEDELSDQVPSERAHEIWAQVPGWQAQFRTLMETVEKKLGALEAVTRRLETDLRATLNQTAPPIQIGPAPRQDKLSFDGQLWYAFAKLDAALAELEVQQIWAMPPHEREARFYSARLKRRLVGDEERQALAHLNLQPAADRRVYELRATSREVKMREDDFHFALAPEGLPGFLDRPFDELTAGTLLEPVEKYPRNFLKDVVSVRIAGLDRDRLLIALDQNTRWPGMLDALEARGLVDFSCDVILDPVYHDYFTKKLLLSLQAIGNPPWQKSIPWFGVLPGKQQGQEAKKAHMCLLLLCSGTRRRCTQHPCIACLRQYAQHWRGMTCISILCSGRHGKALYRGASN